MAARELLVAKENCRLCNYVDFFVIFSDFFDLGWLLYFFYFDSRVLLLQLIDGSSFHG